MTFQTRNMVMVPCVRAPNPEAVLVIRTSFGVFSPGKMHENRNKRKARGSRLVSKRVKRAEPEREETEEEVEPFSAARCRVYKRPRRKVARKVTMPHQLMGPIRHSRDQEPGTFQSPKKFIMLNERLKRMQTTENERVSFGKSGIHG